MYSTVFFVKMKYSRKSVGIKQRKKKSNPKYLIQLVIRAEIEF